MLILNLYIFLEYFMSVNFKFLHCSVNFKFMYL